MDKNVALKATTLHICRKLGGIQEPTIKMKATCIIFLLTSFSLISTGQQIDSKTIQFADDRHYELTQDKPGAAQFLLIRNEENETVRSVKLPEEFDPYRFVANYEGERSFLVIAGRYKFYIFNTTTEKIIGPITCTPRREFLDAQSGVWYAFKIIHEGQYLLANALDLGLYCYDLRDLYHPEEVQFFKTDSNYFSGYYAFVDLRKDNIYNVIIASNGNFKKEITSDIFLIGLRFEQDSTHQLAKEVVNNRYLIFRQIKPDASIERLIIDLQAGKLIDKQDSSDLFDKSFEH